MARYTGPVCRLCRADGRKLMLKGARCMSDKCPMNKKRGAPGKDQKVRPGNRRVRKRVGRGRGFRPGVVLGVRLVIKKKKGSM
jgi:hypothetical protein